MSQVDNRNSFAGKRARTDGGRREDDWTCPNCGNVNFSFRTTCNMRNCTQSRPMDHNVKSTPKSMHGPPPFTSAAGYLGSAVPSSGYGGAPYGSSYFNGSPLPPYDLPAGGSGYPYGYGGRLSVGSPYGPLHMPGPPPYSGGSMLGAGGMYGMPPLMDRYGMGLHMGHGAMGPSRPGAYPEEDFQKKPADAGRDNDWICPNCGNRNFAFRDICNMRKCNTPRPGNQGTKSDNPKGSKPKMPEGSWKCEKCNNINYPFRTKCNRQNCGAERPSEANEARELTSDEDEQEKELGRTPTLAELHTRTHQWQNDASRVDLPSAKTQIMAPRGRKRTFRVESSRSGASQSSDDDTQVQDNPGQESVRGPRTMLHGTTTKTFTDPHATRRAVDILKRRWMEPWTSWRDVPSEEREAMWEFFMHSYTCVNEDLRLIRETWEATLQRCMIEILDHARQDARIASESDDYLAWFDHHPRWMSASIWAQMIEIWINDYWNWKQCFQASQKNCLTGEGELLKYAGGSISLVVHKDRMTKSEGGMPSHAEVFRKAHKKNGTTEFINARSCKFMDYNAALAEKYGDSFSCQFDVNAEAWMKVAGDSGRGRVNGYTSDDSPGEYSIAPHHSRESLEVCLGASSQPSGRYVTEEQMEAVFQRCFKKMQDEISRGAGPSHPPEVEDDDDDDDDDGEE